MFASTVLGRKFLKNNGLKRRPHVLGSPGFLWSPSAYKHIHSTCSELWGLSIVIREYMFTNIPHFKRNQLIDTKGTVKVQFTLEQATKAQRGSTGIALPLFNLGARWLWVVNATPRPLYSGKETRYPFYRRLGGPQNRSGKVRKISPQPGLDPRTVQSVASRYID